MNTFAPALHLPLAFGVEMGRRGSVLVDLETFARLQDEARARGWSFRQLAGWIFQRFFRSIELTPDNQAALTALAGDAARHTGLPWSLDLVANKLLREALALVRAQKLILFFPSVQLNVTEKSGPEQRGGPRGLRSRSGKAQGGVRA